MNCPDCEIDIGFNLHCSKCGWSAPKSSPINSAQKFSQEQWEKNKHHLKELRKFIDNGFRKEEYEPGSEE